MPEVSLEAVRNAVVQLRATAQKWSGKGLTEQDTKNAIIEPMLAALGWPKDDLTRVRAEFRYTAKANPVDYALFDGRHPLVFVEAKALDKSLDDFKFIQQVISYGATAGMEWAVITNGFRWDLYAVLAKSASSEKKVFSCSLADDDIADWLMWITPDRVHGAKLTHFWRALSADRVVRDTVMDMFGRRDEALVSLIAARANLRPRDVAEALQVLQPSFSRATVGSLTKVVEGPAPVVVTDQAAVPVAPSAPELGPPKDDPAKVGTGRDGTITSLSGAEATPGVVLTGASEPAGTRPTRIRVGDQWFQVRSWVDVLLTGLRALEALVPDRFSSCFDSDQYQGRTRRVLARDPSTIRKPVAVGAGFVESNLSATSIVDLLRSVRTDVEGVGIEIEVLPAVTKAAPE